MRPKIFKMSASVKILASILTSAVLWLLSIASPVLAIDPPDTLQINAVYVYHHCLETDDQLYLVEFLVDYTVNPDETITEAFLGRLMDGTEELGVTAPYAFAYLDDGKGYNTGVLAIYFSAADSNLPVWEGVYTMKLEGNPTLDWGGSVPSVSVAAFDLWSSSINIAQTQDELAARILYIASQLEETWSINMIDSTGTISYLSDYGEVYFMNTIPSVRTMAPGAFAGSTTPLQWEYKELTTDYADSRAESVTDTPLDLTSLAEWWGVSRMWASSLLFAIGSLIILYCMLSPTGSYRALSFLSTPLVIAGGYLGMLPLLATVLIGFFAFALAVFTLFYHPSSI